MKKFLLTSFCAAAIFLCSAIFSYADITLPAPVCVKVVNAEAHRAELSIRTLTGIEAKREVLKNDECIYPLPEEGMFTVIVKGLMIELPTSNQLQQYLDKPDQKELLLKISEYGKDSYVLEKVLDGYHYKTTATPELWKTEVKEQALPIYEQPGTFKKYKYILILVAVFSLAAFLGIMLLSSGD
ncbi:hypothetical protein Dip510_000793 [Elusimicrobium posterum]|uniref:hypothetical protein n=1 Tax=Elusimicrobium posterum TaxID=3116653 RepID=UPI003C780187